MSYPRTISKYIVLELFFPFITGVIVFIFLLLTFQVLRLGEFIILHGIPVKTVLELLLYLTVSFLPAAIPLSLLFSILLVFGRLSGDSEITAMKASGISITHLSIPSVLFSGLIAVFTLYMFFVAGPWGNRNFEVLIDKLSHAKIASAIKEGVFTEGFYDLLLYVDKVDSKASKLENVFIYDARKSNLPMIVISQAGYIVSKKSKGSELDSSVLLRLTNGSIHQRKLDPFVYRKIDFEIYDLNLEIQNRNLVRGATPPSMKFNQLYQNFFSATPSRELEIEFHKRLAISIACLIFGFLGVGIGAAGHQRSARSLSMVVTISIMILYWVIYIGGNSLALQGVVSPFIGMWAANIIFSSMSVFFLWKSR